VQAARSSARRRIAWWSKADEDGAMTETLRLYRRLVGARVRAQWQYRTSFVLDSLTVFVITFIDFVEVLVLFRFFPTLDGWSIEEVAFLYGVAGIGFALADLVGGHIEDVSALIRSGQFDALLLRPAGTLMQTIGSDLALRRVGKFAQAFLVLIWSLTRVDIDWTVAKVLLCVAAVLSAAAIFLALFIALSCVQFFVLGAGEIANGFTYGGHYTTQYPVSIYGRWLRRLLSFGFGLAFVSYLPGLAILDKADPLALPEWLRYASPLVGAAMLIVARLVWHWIVRHYRSAGG
jgi:ABC-2 type transport system permease protein